MAKKYFQSPITIIAYKRPGHLRTLLESLLPLNPKTIFFIQDGPKNNKEKKYTDQVTRIIQEKTWANKVHYLISTSNMGLRNRVVTGLNWVFQHTDRSIILEDDCLAEESFYPYCEELLNKYKDEKKVTSIAGYSYGASSKPIPDSYYFSKYVESWGWATWKRAWDLYDDNMSSWEFHKKNTWLRKYLENIWLYRYWSRNFELAINNKVDSWAYRWMYSNFANKGLTIVPRVSMIQNRGWGKEATHTKIRRITTPISEMEFPLTHPKRVIVDKRVDQIAERIMIRDYFFNLIKSPLHYIYNLLKSR